MSLESMMPPNHLIFYLPLLLISVFPSISVFSKESTLHVWWPTYRSFSIRPSNEYSGLISFRIDLLSMGLWTLFSSTKIKNISSSAFSLFYSPTLTCVHVVVIQLLSHVWLFVTPCTAACQASQSTISQSLIKLMCLWCHPTISSSIIPSFPAFNLSQSRGLSYELALHIRWPKNWSFSFSISPSNEYSGLIFFRIDWFDLLAVQGSSPTPQFKSSSSLVLSLLYGPTLTSIYEY